jgi:uncharacterized protein (TIGR02145 family)
MKHLGYIIACFVMLFNVQLVNAQGDVKIGTQVWTSKNLDVNTFRNGDAILEAKNKEEWKSAGTNKKAAYCYYDYDSKNGNEYGKLYNWYAVNDSRGLAPKGYYIPSDADWTILTDMLGGEEIAGKKMKSTIGWSNSGIGNNSSGFNALPGGYYYGGGDCFDYAWPFHFATGYGAFWSSSESSAEDVLAGSAWYRVLCFTNTEVYRRYDYKYDGMSVRCLSENGDIKFGSNSNHVSNVENISEKINNTILQNYSTVTIGTQVWDSKNLDVSTFRNGEPIPEVKNKDEWITAGKEKKAAFCYYNYDMKNGAIHGKLYNFYAVQDSRGLAPYGYHIPTDTEWTVLTQYLGGVALAGHTMKSKTGWYESGNGDNSSLFNGLPGGSCEIDGNFVEITEMGNWWSSSVDNLDKPYYKDLFYDTIEIGSDVCSRNYGLSIRCIKD